MRCISVTTDFGSRDWFVGTMKGVILGIAPQARIVDLCHEIPPGDLRAGAFALAAACPYFPQGTIHLAVVDPGVGSERPAIVAQTDRFQFVAPDNGLLTLCLAGQPVRAIHRIENARLMAPARSATFHGRDVFAPVAAHLAADVPIADTGPAISSIVRLLFPDPVPEDGRTRGEVLYIDRFGNAISNLTLDKESTENPDRFEMLAADASPVPVCRFYGAVSPGRPLAVAGSTGYLEIAVNRGDAAAALGLRVGSPVWLRRLGTNEPKNTDSE